MNSEEKNKLAQAIEKIRALKRNVKSPFARVWDKAIDAVLEILKSAFSGGAFINVYIFRGHKSDCAINQRGICSFGRGTDKCPCSENIGDNPNCPAFVWREKT